MNEGAAPGSDGNAQPPGPRSGEFSLTSWRISIDGTEEELIRLIKAPSLPGDAQLLSTLAHEYHHWCSTFLSTYGLFVNVCRIEAANTAAFIVRSERDEAPSPAATDIPESRPEAGRVVASELQSARQTYLAVHEFVDLLVGSKRASYERFCELLPQVLHLFQDHRDAVANETVQPSRSCLRAAAVGHQHGQMFRPSARFVSLLATSFEGLTKPHYPDFDVHVQISKQERLNWPTFLEGHAKYFQRAYESVILSQSGTECVDHAAMHGQKSYEASGAVYSHLLQVMSDTKGLDRAWCEAADIITMLSLADLASNPALDAEFFWPSERFPSIQTFIPAQRFMWACTKAQNIKTIVQRLDDRGWGLVELERAYIEYISECCDALEWECPWVQANRWVEYYDAAGYPVGSHGFVLALFLEGCKLRLECPLFFGIPSHATRQTKRGLEYWFAILSSSLSAPAFACGTSLPLIRVNEKSLGRSRSPRLFAMLSVALDQFVTRGSIVDWDAVVRSLGEGSIAREAGETLVTEELAKLGIVL